MSVFTMEHSQIFQYIIYNPLRIVASTSLRGNNELHISGVIFLLLETLCKLLRISVDPKKHTLINVMRL